VNARLGEKSKEVFCMAVQKRTSKNVLLDTALKNFYAAAEEMNLDEGLVEVLSRPERAICVSVPVVMDDGSVRVFEGYRVQHSTVCGPAKGGLRFHPDVTLEECEALASLMTWKCSLAGIPYGGGKGGIAVDPFELSPREREMMTRTFAARIAPFVGDWTDVPAPDVNTGGPEMVWIMDTISKLRGRLEPGVVTGKPIAYWGSKGRTAATGLGVATCVLELLKTQNVDPKTATVIVQGFGNVGTWAAKHAYDLGYRIIGISDVTGGYYNENGLDIDDVLTHTAKSRHNLLEGYAEADQISNAELLALECDVLAPCALENQITEDNAHNIKASMIVEGANGPTTPEADDILTERGIEIVPDILANAGGVTVSYFEWVQGLQAFFWDVEEVNRQLRRVLIKAYDEVVSTREQFDVDMRTAAQITAIKRVGEATRTRGIYP